MSAELNKTLAESERGSIMLEMSITAPVLVILFFFCVDFLLYTKSMTYVEQVARDAAIFLAVTPGNLAVQTYSSGAGQLASDSQMCAHGQALNPDPDNMDPTCLHVMALSRVERMLQAHGTQLNEGNFSMSSTYDGTNVNIAISSNPAVLFGIYGIFNKNKTVTRQATLKRVTL